MILDQSFHLDRLTALVGKNGAGKSSFLRALEMFYDPSAKLTDEDFYAEDTSRDIEIALTFSDLSSNQRDFFAPYVDNEELTIARVFSRNSGARAGTYHGSRLQNPEFADTRAAGPKMELRNRYNALRSNEKYTSLPAVRSADDATSALSQWENANPNECSRMRDDGQFFGFTEVGRGYLGRHTTFIRVPAVRDALGDSAEGRDSCLTEIMDLVVRNALSTRDDVARFRAQTQDQYLALFDPSKLPELRNLQGQLTETLSQYAPDASVALTWSKFSAIPIPMPEAEVKLSEDGYESAVENTGHGLQRAFILTMLQHLVAARDREGSDAPRTGRGAGLGRAPARHLPSLVFSIEEPEIYQHPGRQRHMASVLLRLAEGAIPGVAEHTQVVYTTHAPLFVGLDRFDQVRLLRKDNGRRGMPMVTVVTHATLKDVGQRLAALRSQAGETVLTPDTLRPRMQALMTPRMNEGFFADVVVLVEGERDCSALLAVAATGGHDLELMGVCIVPCGGKNNIARPAVVFASLGIRTYLVWDNDKNSGDGECKANRQLLKLVGAPEEDWPDGVWDTHACLDGDLERTLRQEISETVFNGPLEESRSEFAMNKRSAKKNPVVLRRIIERANARGHVSGTLVNVVERIRACLEARHAGR